MGHKEISQFSGKGISTRHERLRCRPKHSHSYSSLLDRMREANKAPAEQEPHKPTTTATRCQAERRTQSYDCILKQKNWGIICLPKGILFCSSIGIATHETCLIRSPLYHQTDRSSEGCFDLLSQILATRQFTGTTAIYFKHLKKGQIFGRVARTIHAPRWCHTIHGPTTLR